MQIQASRRKFLSGALAAGVVARASFLHAQEAFTPESFGARGDGRTNDTDAFAALSNAINARGGGMVVLRPTTYIVGHGDRRRCATGRRKGAFAFPPSTILNFANCTGPVVIRGNGARLRAASGLRFGSFDPQTGRAVDHPLPLLDRGLRASPYVAMINVQDCAGSIDISDLELDGNQNRFGERVLDHAR